MIWRLLRLIFFSLKICITTLRESNNLSLQTVSSHAFYLESFSPFRPKISVKFKLLPRFHENKSPPVVHNTIWYLHACVQYSGAHWGLSVFFVCCFQGLIALYDSVKKRPVTKQVKYTFCGYLRKHITVEKADIDLVITGLLRVLVM